MRIRGQNLAVFFDKDGVVNELVDRGEEFLLAGRPVRLTAPWKPSELKLYDALVPVLLEVKAREYLAIVITNQPDVRYGVMDRQLLRPMLNAVKGLGFDDLYVCVHGRDDGCDCRKPKPGMLLAAAKRWNIDLRNSIMVGDMATDVEAAQAAGCAPLLVDRPYNRHVHSAYRVGSVQELVAYL
jgi:D-glycero-D-manno-heptose 1,7-bisphosphate phosphatase